MATAHRQRIKPGITGWAQVNGFRGETKTMQQIEGRVVHDIFYIDNWSVFLDLWILVLTVISPPPAATPTSRDNLAGSAASPRHSLRRRGPHDTVMGGGRSQHRTTHTHHVIPAKAGIHP